MSDRNRLGSVEPILDEHQKEGSDESKQEMSLYRLQLVTADRHIVAIGPTLE